MPNIFRCFSGRRNKLVEVAVAVAAAVGSSRFNVQSLLIVAKLETRNAKHETIMHPLNQTSVYYI
jgi:hypothetical protein